MKNTHGVALEVTLVKRDGSETWLPSAKRKHEPVLKWEGKEYLIRETKTVNNEEEYTIKHYEA